MPELSLSQSRLPLKVDVTTLLVFLAVTFRFASPVSADLSYMLLAVIALLGRRQAIIALALSWLFTMVNPGLSPEAPLGAMGRYFVIIAAALSVLLRTKTKSQCSVRGLIWATWLFAAFVLVHSLLFSPHVDVSLLKFTSWLMVFLTLVSAWNGLMPDARERFSNQLFWAFVAFAFLSSSLFFLPVGYLRNGSGFQGLLNHPQAFGLTMAFLGAWAFTRLLSVRRVMYAELAAFFLAILLVVASETRTAGVALSLSILASLGLVRLTSRKRLSLLLPAFKSRNFRFLFLCVTLVLLMLTPKITQVANDFISKSGRADVSDLITAYEVSRSVLYIPILENIASDPWKGIGYGISSDPQLMVVQRDPLFGFPVGAPIEKGIMPLAILEELGVLGFGIFVLWLLVALRYAMKGGLIGLALIFLVLLVNLGEAVFFSPGGMGLLTLLFFTYSVTLVAAEKRKSRNAE
jgi:hypothetical protein